MPDPDSGSPARPLISIVIPVFNEEQNIAPLVAEIEEALPLLSGPAEVLLVDDGSHDRSWEEINVARRGRPWLKALRFLGNQGQTAAIAAGIEAASGELIAFMDADLQNDPRDLPALVAPILEGTADVVCGWRTHRHDKALSRVIPSMIANSLIRVSLGLKLHDLGCTLKVFRRAYLEDVSLLGEMHRFIPAYAAAQGARIAELPVNHRERKYGQSKYGLTRIYKVLIDLVTVKMLNTYGTKPAYFFGKIGLAFFGGGTASLALVAYRVFVLGRTEATPMIFIMMLLYVASLVCFMSGLLAEINIRVLHASSGTRPFKISERAGFSQTREGV
ncbi:MAG TPA: glycosyltransferase family 2 protein [Candidatus Saccharimonadales bacterium]|nr:glycosyltransferase family 2 protein [Candidatus Saccharimonadales bacterium]